MSAIEDNVIVDPVALRRGLESLQQSSANIQKQVGALEGVVTEISNAFKGETSTKFQSKMKVLSNNFTTAKASMDKVLVAELNTLIEQYGKLESTSSASADELHSDFKMQ